MKIPYMPDHLHPNVVASDHFITGVSDVAYIGGQKLRFDLYGRKLIDLLSQHNLGPALIIASAFIASVWW